MRNLSKKRFAKLMKAKKGKQYMQQIYVFKNM